jgi:hypothetical protein
VARGFAPVPSLPLFSDFVRAKVLARLPTPLRQPRRDAVLRLEPVEGAGGCLLLQCSRGGVCFSWYCA